MCVYCKSHTVRGSLFLSQQCQNPCSTPTTIYVQYVALQYGAKFLRLIRFAIFTDCLRTTKIKPAKHFGILHIYRIPLIRKSYFRKISKVTNQRKLCTLEIRRNTVVMRIPLWQKIINSIGVGVLYSLQPQEDLHVHDLNHNSLGYKQPYI